MKKSSIVTLAIGSAFAAVALVPAAYAAEGNPFALSKLDAGYQLAQADTKQKDGKCGEAKCGADKKGSDKKMDGACGADKKGADKKKDGKCGEAKCGADKKK